MSTAMETLTREVSRCTIELPDGVYPLRHRSEGWGQWGSSLGGVPERHWHEGAEVTGVTMIVETLEVSDGWRPGDPTDGTWTRRWYRHTRVTLRGRDQWGVVHRREDVWPEALRAEGYEDLAARVAAELGRAAS